MEIELILGLVGVVLSVAISAISLAYWLGRKFAEIGAGIRDIGRGISRLGLAMTESSKAILELLVLKKVVAREEAEYAMKRIETIASMALADPAKEELELVKRMASKSIDEVTPEEMDKVYELALKWWKEEFDDKGLAIALLVPYVRSYILSKKADSASPPSP